MSFPRSSRILLVMPFLPSLLLPTVGEDISSPDRVGTARTLSLLPQKQTAKLEREVTLAGLSGRRPGLSGTEYGHLLKPAKVSFFHEGPTSQGRPTDRRWRFHLHNHLSDGDLQTFLFAAEERSCCLIDCSNHKSIVFLSFLPAFPL